MRYKLVTVKNLITLSSKFEEVWDTSLEFDRIGTISGITGAGKSTAVIWLVNRKNAILVRAESLWNPSVMTEAILQELAVSITKMIAKRIKAIAENMKATKRPLFVDESEYLLRNPKLLDAIRDIHDISRMPVWLIGVEGIERELANHKLIAGRIAQEVRFLPCDLEDALLLAKELCEVKVEEDLVSKLRDESGGSIRLITTGLRRIESFTRSQNWESINTQQWENRPFFLKK